MLPTRFDDASVDGSACTGKLNVQHVQVQVDEKVRRERRWTSAGATPARELVRSTGSNRSGSGGNKTVGAFDGKGR